MKTEESRKRTASTSSFFNVLSDVNSTEATSTSTTPTNKLDKTLEIMIEENGKMQRAAKTHKKISKDVKESLKILRSIVVDMQNIKTEGKSISTLKCLHNPSDSLDKQTETQKGKQKRVIKIQQSVTIQVTVVGGITNEIGSDVPDKVESTLGAGTTVLRWASTRRAIRSNVTTGLGWLGGKGDVMVSCSTVDFCQPLIKGLGV